MKGRESRRRAVYVITTICPLVLAGCARSVPLLCERDFTCASFAKSINHFVALGENAAVRELYKLAAENNERCDCDEKGEGIDRDARIAWICRVLFEPRGSKPLRGPLYGSPGVPYLSMPEEDWPLLPVAKQGLSYFVLSRGYFLASGAPEEPERYIEYCTSHGTFRKSPVPVPTRAQAIRDALMLQDTPRWSAIKWKDAGHNWSYTYSKAATREFVEGQADRIPGKLDLPSMPP